MGKRTTENAEVTEETAGFECKMQSSEWRMGKRSAENAEVTEDLRIQGSGFRVQSGSPEQVQRGTGGQASSATRRLDSVRHPGRSRKGKSTLPVRVQTGPSWGASLVCQWIGMVTNAAQCYLVRGLSCSLRS